jgi:predicted TIM-barrel fold metal-dependent hydrolase
VTGSLERTAAELLLDLPLVDGHCHTIPPVPPSGDPGAFGFGATEADGAAPPGLSLLDGAVGLAIRRWCAPVLDLSVGVPIDEYLARRAELGPEEVASRLLRAAGLSHVVIDSGLGNPEPRAPAELGAAAGAEVREVVRLERVAEGLAHDGVSASGFAAAYVQALAESTIRAVATKSVLAYRGGFTTDLRDRPSPTEVRTAAGRWLARPRAAFRLDDPVLLRFVLWCGIERGLPLQIHTGFGDRDLRLAAADPALLQPFLAATEPRGVPVVLLHCYPYHRQAGWLAQVFPHVYVDVGLAVAQVGPRAMALLGECCELTPFGKLLFSTNGYALPELFLVGAAQFRHSFGRLLTTWVSDGSMPAADAARVASLVGSVNALRLYGL